MKIVLTEFEKQRNLYFRSLVLERDFKQNSNDLKHRDVYDHFMYKLIGSKSGRVQYCKSFILIK